MKKIFRFWMITAVMIMGLSATACGSGSRQETVETAETQETAAAAKKQETAAEERTSANKASKDRISKDETKDDLSKESSSAAQETSETTDEQDTQPAPETAAGGTQVTPFSEYTGDWTGQMRCFIDIAPAGADTCDIYVDCPGGASFGVEFHMTGIYDAASGELNYTDGEKISYEFQSENSEPLITTVYTGGYGRLYIQDRYLHWEEGTDEFDYFSKHSDIPVIPDQSSAANAVYMIPDSDIVYLSETDLAGLTPEQLRIGKNEIYARHGRKFQSADLQAYFEAQSWYNGTIEADQFDDSVLSDLERANIRLIQKCLDQSGAGA